MTAANQVDRLSLDRGRGRSYVLEGVSERSLERDLLYRVKRIRSGLT
jgi:hypothetical protein